MSIQTTMLTQLYPILVTGIHLHLTPNDSYIFSKNLIIPINRDAATLLRLSNGKRSISTILKTACAENEANDAETKKNVLAFFIDAEKKGYVILQTKQSSNSYKIPVTGDFSVFYPYMLSIELTHQCNLQCAHCYLDAGPGKKPVFIDTNKLISCLDALHLNGLQIVELTGGEALLHPDFYRILDFCVSKFMWVSVLSNGTLIGENEARKFAKYKEKISISISVDGSTPEIHEKIRRVPGSFHKAVTAIQLLSKYGMNVRVAMTTTTETVQDIENTLLLAKKSGASSFNYSSTIPFGRGKNINWNVGKQGSRRIGKLYEKLAYTYPDFLRVYKEDEQYKQEMKRRKNCGAGYLRITMSPTGALRPCLLAPQEWFDMGNILDNSLDDMLTKPLNNFFIHLQKPNKDLEPCKECQYKFYCDSCWVRALQKNISEDLNCPWFRQSKINKFLKVKPENK
ncbi:MAG: radical SAM protein [Methanobacteriota archaeon]